MIHYCWKVNLNRNQEETEQELGDEAGSCPGDTEVVGMEEELKI